MAAGKDYFNVGEYEVSQDNRLLAWAEDDVGRRQYTIRFRNLDTGEACPDVITGVSPNLVWADDNRTVLYVEKIGRAHVCTPVTNAHLVCRLLLEKKNIL